MQPKKLILTGAQAESLLEDTIDRVADMHERLAQIEAQVSQIPEVKTMLQSVSIAQTAMAQSAQSMADTFRKFEDRAERQEIRYAALSETVAGKGQIPLKSHYWTVAISLVPTLVMALGVVLTVLYVTHQDLEASLSKISINQAQTQALVAEAKEQVKEVQSIIDEKKELIKK